MHENKTSHHIALIYRFLARSMTYPSNDWFNDEYLDSLYLLLESLGASKEISELKSSFSASSETLSDIEIEHTRLFINGVPHVAAPPYGSVYIDKSLLGKHSEKILRFYQEHGYRMKDDSDLPDHLVHQLEFLSLISEREDIKAEAEFLSTLFLPWFITFKKRVIEEASHPFYPIIVQLISFFTMEENKDGI